MNKQVGEIYVFQYPACTPDELRAHPELDCFMVYNGDTILPQVCKWQDNAFWHRWGETDADWEAMMNVEFWFRIPETIEIASGEEQPIQEGEGNG